MPAPPPPVPWPTPRAAAARPTPSITLDGWLRESAGWLVGAALTVVGSVYLAGTLWDGLSAGWRTTITLVFLALWSLGFGAAGRRLVARGLGAGRWLIGVGAALAPVHAMAAGALWPHWGAVVALGAVAAVQGWALRRAAADLAPGGGLRLWAPWLGLALSAGLMPLHLGPVVPTLLAGAAAWAIGVRRGPGLSAAVLVGIAWALHPLFGGVRSASELALPLALLSAVGLYADLAWARWRGLVRVGLEGWRGLGVTALALAALLCTLPTFAPLPSGLGALGAYGVVAGVAFAAALAWRRPALVGLTLVGGIGAALVVPSLARPLVEAVSQQASHGLGYGGAPLPLAWRALTLLPWLAVWLAAADLVPRTGWRQGRALREHMRRWAFGVGVALLAFSLGLPDDPRPYVLAAPLYAIVGLLRPRLAVPRPVDVAIGCLPVVAGALWFALLPACLPASLGIPALAGRLAMTGWLCAVALRWRDRTAALTTLPLGLALVVLDPSGLGPLGAGLVGFAWLLGPRLGAEAPLEATSQRGSDARSEHRDEGAQPLSSQEPRIARAVAGIAPGLLILGLVLQAPAGGLPWTLLGGTAGIAAASAWFDRRARVGVRTLLAWAVVGAAAAATAGLELDDPARVGLRLALGALMLAWARQHRALEVGGVRVAPLFGAAVAAGVAEGVGRRLWVAGVDPAHVASAAALAVALWAVLTRRIGGKHPWIAEGVAAPARWIGGLLVAAGVVNGLAAGAPTATALAATALPLVLAAWLLAARGSEAPAWVAVALGASSKAVAVPAGLALGLIAVPTAGAAAIAVSALSGAWHGPLGAGWVGLAAAAAAIGIRALREPNLRAPALVAAVGVAGVAVEAWVRPASELHLLALVAVGAALAAARLPALARLPWREPAAVTGHWLAMAAIPLLAVDLALGAGPLHAVAALGAAGYALAARQPWAARAAAAIALVAALLAAQATLPVWVLAGTAALAADHCAVTWRGRAARREEAAFHLAAAACVAPALVLAAGGPLPVAGCWPVLAWVAGSGAAALGAVDRVGRPLPPTLLVPAGLVAALVQAASVAPGGIAWGLLLAAAALGVDRARPVRAAAVGLGAAVVVGSSLGAPGVVEVAVLTALTAAWRAWRPESALDRWTATPVTAAAAVLVLLAAVQAEILRDVPPVDPAALLLAGATSATVAGPARWVLGPLGAVLVTVAAAHVLPAPEVVVPLVLIGLAAAAAVSTRLAERGLPAFEAREDADVLLTLAGAATVGAALTALPSVDTVRLALELGLVAGVAGIRRRGEVAASTSCAALWLLAQAWAPQPAPVQLAVILAVGWGAGPFAPWSHRASRLALPAAGAVAAALVGLGPAGWAVLGLGVALELVAAMRRSEPAGLALPLVHAGLVLATMRLFGPLAAVPSDALLPIAVGAAVLLEAAGGGLARWRGADWAAPVQHAAVGLVGLAVVDGLLHGVPGALGLAAAGAWFCGRHAMRGGVGDLLVGAALLDAGALLLAADIGLDQPLAYVAPVSLSALAVAQRLRGTVHPDALALIRYAAAGATYVTCFGHAVAEPVYTSVLVLLAVGGIAAGEILRVRSYLHLGVGFLGAALGWNLLRFGLSHAQFWALYLTGLGLLVLGAMVLLTLNRDAVRRARRWMSSHLAAWER